MSNSDKVDALKAEGNEAIKNRDFQKAIDKYTEAIKLDPKNHVLYSNRAAAYLGVDPQGALNDAKQVISLKPDWDKGYFRLGTAHKHLGNLEEAVKSFDEGLKVQPQSTMLQNAKKEAQEAVMQRGMQGFGMMFKDPNLWAKLALNPQTRNYSDQPDFVAIVNQLQQDPSKIQQYMGDQRVQTMLGVLLNAAMGQQAPASTPTTPMQTEPTPVPKEEKKEEPKEEKKEEVPENVQKALEHKNAGNAFYKQRKFEEALKEYDEALKHDENNMSCYLNKTAVCFEKGDLEECLALCDEAIKKGRSIYADYSIIAKAFLRKGNAYTKLEKWEEAIEAYKSSLTENRTPQALQGLKKAEKAKEEAEKKAYLNPELSVKEREAGNDLFKKHDFPGAIKRYEEAIKRNPEDHLNYSNLASSLMKLGEFQEAQKYLDKVLELDPKFVKGYLRKGQCLMMTKEYNKVLQCYSDGLKQVPDSQELQSALRGAEESMMQRSQGEGDVEAAQRAMADPEIQQILRDPYMKQVLSDLQTNPAAAQGHMSNPDVARKLTKLINAGILRTG